MQTAPSRPELRTASGSPTRAMAVRRAAPYRAAHEVVARRGRAHREAAKHMASSRWPTHALLSCRLSRRRAQAIPSRSRAHARATHVLSRVLTA